MQSRIPLGPGKFHLVVLVLRNYAELVETVSGELVDFRKTGFHDSLRQTEAEGTNEREAA